MFLEKSSGGSEMIVKKFQRVFGTLAGFAPGGGPARAGSLLRMASRPLEKPRLFRHFEKNLI